MNNQLGANIDSDARNNETNYPMFYSTKRKKISFRFEELNNSMDVSQKEIPVICSSTNFDEIEMMSKKPRPKITSRRINGLKRSASGKSIKHFSPNAVSNGS